jgi:predicted alpha/beta-fold hydrolase
MGVARYPVPCDPPPWARGGHAQTCFGHLSPARGAVPSCTPEARRIEVMLADGDRLVAHALPAAAPSSGARVHLFHGLSGDADVDYMRRSAAVLRARGHEVWAVNHRGCGAGRGLAARPYHSGSSADLAAVLAASQREAPELRHQALGFSLSGNALLLMAAEARAPWLAGLIAVNPPIDLARTAADIHRGFCRLYELRFLRRLRRAIAERQRAGLVSRGYRISPFASLRELDDLYTAPEGGFTDSADYYARCSAGPRLAAITTPGVVLTAADDPIVAVQSFHAAVWPATLFLHVEPRGGHVGYLARAGLGARSWLDGALVHYVEELASRFR